MSLTKVNYIDNSTIITAQNLNDIQDNIIQNAEDLNNIQNNIIELNNNSISKDNIINNFTTMEEGFVADARALKILNDSKLSMELLWENASPTSECDNLTVDNLDLSSYSHVLIEVMYATTLQWVIGQVCKIGHSNVISAAMTKNYYRMIDTNTASVHFGKANVYNTYAGNAVTITTYLIPYKIYGIKGVSA